jgi:hypothetical protein
MYTAETLRHIGAQVEALTSRHCSLQPHKRAIERQLASIAAQIHEPDVVLTPRTVFLLLEMRGSGGVSDHLEQIARILHEEGYWKPHERVWNSQGQDVYYLGKSAQSRWLAKFGLKPGNRLFLLVSSSNKLVHDALCQGSNRQ